MGMASRPLHLPFLSLAITILSTFTRANSFKSPPPPCGAFDCGNGVTLNYPFHSQFQQSMFCGYPKFAVSCTNNQPILKIANNSYTITNHNSSDNSITVAYGAAAVATCPVATHGVTLDSDSILSYTNQHNKIVQFFYNCTVYPPSVPNIKCLQRGAKHSYAFMEGAVPEFNWIQYCESIVTVPVIENAVDDVVGNGSGNAQQLGFKLTWKSVDDSCQLCEGSGGFCGYGGVDQKFLCFCSDGKQSSPSCLGGGQVSKSSQPNYVAIGAGIGGGVLVMIITILVLFINKRNAGFRKHGFSQISITTSGK